MTERTIQVQDVVRRKATQLGPHGREWLAGLPGLVDDVARRWSIMVGAPLSGGTTSYVARARTADGQDAVLKLAVPEPGFGGQVRTLLGADGQGYVRLLAHDAERHAVLMEALGPPLEELEVSPADQIATLCTTLHRAWQAPRPPEPAVDPALGLAELVSTLWDQLGQPCSERVAARALICAERRAAAFDPDRSIVVHGDPRPANLLRVRAPRPGAESGFVFVDPDGFLADPTYDLGVVLRDWCPQLLAGDAPALAQRYCALLAGHTGLEETAIWEWGFLQRVSTGLYLLSFGAGELARPYLDSAELLV